MKVILLMIFTYIYYILIKNIYIYLEYVTYNICNYIYALWVSDGEPVNPLWFKRIVKY